jgi:hypothetical protein
LIGKNSKKTVLTKIREKLREQNQYYLNRCKGGEMGELNNGNPKARTGDGRKDEKAVLGIRARIALKS